MVRDSRGGTLYLPGEVLQLVRSQVKLFVGRLHAVGRAAVGAAQPSQAHDGPHPRDLSPLLPHRIPRKAKRQRHASVRNMTVFPRLTAETPNNRCLT